MGIKTIADEKWTVEFEREPLSMNGEGHYVVNADNGIVCRTEESTIEQTRERAQLIGTAPELLKALEEELDSMLAVFLNSDAMDALCAPDVFGAGYSEAMANAIESHKALIKRARGEG